MIQLQVIVDSNIFETSNKKKGKTIIRKFKFFETKNVFNFCKQRILNLDRKIDLLFIIYYEKLLVILKKKLFTKCLKMNANF